MLRAEDMQRILMIETNQARGHTARPLVSPVSGLAGIIFADGAVSALVTTAPGDFEVLALAQVVKPIDKHRIGIEELTVQCVSGYRHVYGQALSLADIRPAQIDRVFLNNVHSAGLSGIVATIGLPAERVCTENLARIAHVWSADNLINLHDYCRRHRPEAGTIFLLMCQADSFFSALVCRKRSDASAMDDADSLR
jgi:3-oxoacyl-[acyl-carrier-protein] synthase III